MLSLTMSHKSTQTLTGLLQISCNGDGFERRKIDASLLNREAG